ncbi:hypothetical protein J6S46_03465 [Candidatus Saccharibacteria bacterium]|nr:hypothetical protein [Candidatus Saccharibacteria bacterium]
MENYEVILALILGAFVCLFGYKLKKIVFFIAWFLIGYTLMSRFMPFINQSVPAIAESSLWQFILPIAGGLLLSLLGFSIEKLCVGLLAFFTTLAVAVNQFGVSGEVIGIACILGVILGAVAVNMIKPATIIITAIAGSYVMTDAIIALFPGSLARGSVLALLVLAGIALVGAIFQFSNTKHYV